MPRVFAALENLGRQRPLELVGKRNGAPIFVDYAHKPDALAKALQALRPYAAQLVVVFGAGGDRDAGKRPLMGEIAAENADGVIVTDDNPRSENPAAIRAAIMAAAKGASEIGDRAEAIRAAIAGLEPGDALLSPARATRPARSSATTTLPFSDHEAVARALAEGRMSTPLVDLGRDGGSDARVGNGALPEASPAFPSTAAPSRRAKRISPSRATSMTAMPSSRPR